MTTAPNISNGSRVVVTHDKGDELGTVVGVVGTGRYHVRFDDQTISSWPKDVVRLATEETPVQRLEYLRGEISAERISYSEVAELQSLAEHIDPSDTELLTWATNNDEEQS